MQFEWDEKKNEKLKADRGLSFEDARQVWDDPDRIVIPSSQETDEPRFLTIGKIGTKIHAVIFTIRGSATRLISVRRAHPNEEKRYEQR